MQNTKTTRPAAALPALLMLCLCVAGCRHRRAQAPPPPAPPQIQQPEAERRLPPPAILPEPSENPHERVLSTEVGIASWYGAPYHNARGANGKIYNQNAMTAAHRTLPLGTVARVTNLATRQSVVVTITDRGPFVRGRMLDLSRAAAIKIGVWRTGTARVRLEVLSSPPSASRQGKWCVQIGVLAHSSSARKLRDRLQREYPTARVIDFKGVTGYWVRIKTDGESRRDALQVASEISLPEGYPYVVRLN